MILILNNLFLPRVSQFLFDGKGIAEYDVRTVFVYLIYLLFRGAVLFISRYIPLGIGGLDDKLISSVSLFKGNILVENYESIGFWTKVFLLGMIIVVLIFLIAPVFIGGVVYTGRVIARFSKLEKEENERKDQYEKKRNLMLSDIAHDLRTPITTIYGYSQAILDGKAGEDKRDEYLNLICLKSKKVDELITIGEGGHLIAEGAKDAFGLKITEFDNKEEYSTSGIKLIMSLVNKMTYMRVLSLNNTIFEIKMKEN